MASLGLHHLIQAIAGAVAEAQDKIHRFQIATVRQYFDENNRPVSVDVRLPDPHPNAEPGDERIVRVPLLSLVGPQLLSIKEAEVSFEVGLTGVDADDAPLPPPKGARPSDGTAAAAPGETDSGAAADGSDGSAADDANADWRGVGLSKVLGVDMGGAKGKGPGATAKVTLKVESQVPSDGMTRLIQHLDKLI